MQSLAASTSQVSLPAGRYPGVYICCRSSVCCSRARHGFEGWVVRAQTRSQQKTTADMTIDDLDDNYCDDFECTSSPAVEMTVRSVARDITRFKFNTTFLQPDVQYSDGVRSFKSADKYRSAFWAKAALKNPRATVIRMAMLSNGKAQINWQLEGQLAIFSVTIPVTTVLELNLVTGRVTSYTDAFDLSKLSPPAAAFCTLSRMLWSAKAAGRDAGDNISKGVTQSLSSLTSMDEDEYYMNPTDPTRVS
eukprot:GHRR01020253.1.p1 GENE.GHRR01020253.1~~GHRR01020253.1.p1  ORF type:complete len:249 (+),score=28.78 GHRR01020253.1:60-806(+)